MGYAEYMKQVTASVRKTEEAVLLTQSHTSTSVQDRLKAATALRLISIAIVLLFELDFIRHASREDLADRVHKRKPSTR